ncbi:MAG: hypothetical protein KDI68_09705 [Gammaproteobacteria bacterium]|nr:hypothetical protein [Gammaproteobacteria bacterium]
MRDRFEKGANYLAGLTLNIASAVEAREAIAKGVVAAMAMIYIEVATLVGIPFALAQLLIGGTSRSALERNCRQIWRVNAVILLGLLFCLLAAVVFSDIGGVFYFLLLPMVLSLPLFRAVAALRSVGEELNRVPDSRLLSGLMFGLDGPRTRRGHSATRMRRAILWFGLAGVLIAGVIALIAAQGEYGFRASIVTLCILLGGVVVQHMLHRGQRHSQASAEERRSADERAPVLVLRSFRDDRIRFERGLRGVFNALQPSFEQLVAREAEALGPVITIGRPGERLPPLGAAREYLRGDEWQGAVARLMVEAETLIFVLGETEGLAWEFRAAVGSAKRKDSVLLLVPPLEPGVLASRWSEFVGGNRELLGAHFPQQPPQEPVVAVGLLADAALLIVAGGRRKWDYRLAIRLWIRLKTSRLSTGSAVRNHLSANAPSVGLRLLA